MTPWLAGAARPQQQHHQQQRSPRAPELHRRPDGDGGQQPLAAQGRLLPMTARDRAALRPAQNIISSGGCRPRALRAHPPSDKEEERAP